MCERWNFSSFLQNDLHFEILDLFEFKSQIRLFWRPLSFCPYYPYFVYQSLQDLVRHFILWAWGIYFDLLQTVNSLYLWRYWSHQREEGLPYPYSYIPPALPNFQDKLYFICSFLMFLSRCSIFIWDDCVHELCYALSFIQVFGDDLSLLCLILIERIRKDVL